MGKLFNELFMNMPSSEVKKRRGSVKVTENRIYGQTNGYLESVRKDYNKENSNEETSPQEVVDQMVERQEEEQTVKAKKLETLREKRELAERADLKEKTALIKSSNLEVGTLEAPLYISKKDREKMGG